MSVLTSIWTWLHSPSAGVVLGSVIAVEQALGPVLGGNPIFKAVSQASSWVMGVIAPSQPPSNPPSAT